MVVTPGTGEPDTGTSRSRARAACVGAGDRPQSGGDPAPAVRGLKPPRAGAALPAASLSDAGLLLPSPPALRAQGPLSFCREDPSPPAEVEGKDLALVEPEGGAPAAPHLTWTGWEGVTHQDVVTQAVGWVVGFPQRGRVSCVVTPPRPSSPTVDATPAPWRKCHPGGPGPGVSRGGHACS